MIVLLPLPSIPKIYAVCGGKLSKRFCKMFSEFHRPLGLTAAAMMPQQARELSENILQNLFNKLLTQNLGLAFFDPLFCAHVIHELPSGHWPLVKDLN